MVFEWTDEEGYTFKTGDGGKLLFVSRPGRDGWAPAHPLMAMGGLAEAERRLEVYRKALEPFLHGFKDHHYAGAPEARVEIPVPIPGEHHAAILEACRLMGIPLEGKPKSDG